ncbi:MAG: phosphatidate cytidylyltransferase [Lachnospiraceae bacterium]|nr:phosphatidate cytidylyltransferase [Lachnospiraceae bacterium]
MFKTRVISGAILIILIAVMNITGGPLMGAILFLIAVQGLFEFYRATGVYIEGGEERHNVFERIGYVGTAIYFLSAVIIKSNSLLKLVLILCIVCIAMLAAYVFTFPKYDGYLVMKAFFGFMYVPVMLCFIYLTRSMPCGEYLVWLIYISSWICDTCAYLTGMKFGKRKLAPVLSPHKSVEGAIGGIIGTVLISVLFSFLFMKVYDLKSAGSVLVFVLLGIVGAVVSQVGDLAASAFKRNNDVKDYGVIIPGHGGIMDRFDSVIFTAPMIYFLAAIFFGI